MSDQDLDLDWITFLSDTEQVEYFLHYSYTNVASACLLYYDCCLTFKDEVKLVKEKRFSLATVLYMVLRYGFLYLATTGIIQNVPVSESFQRRLTTPRASGLYSLLYGYVITTTPWPVGGCLASISLSNELADLDILYEALCLLLTVGKTLQTYRRGRLTGMNAPLSKLLLRDGSIYFAIFSTLAIFDVATGLAQNNKLPSGLITTFSRSLIPILLTRFISRIRQVNGEPESSVGSGEVSTVAFGGGQDRFLGSIEGDLEFDGAEEHIDQEEDSQVGHDVDHVHEDIAENARVSATNFGIGVDTA
ncbi:hypothetical protein C8Q76DRAFT_786766 [Earliella scabrosa]|nr:hypothetical protein C8Q76DRAFT_786766 [Earliella scabrosa]